MVPPPRLPQRQRQRQRQQQKTTVLRVLLLCVLFQFSFIISSSTHLLHGTDLHQKTTEDQQYDGQGPRIVLENPSKVAIDYSEKHLDDSNNNKTSLAAVRLFDGSSSCFLNTTQDVKKGIMKFLGNGVQGLAWGTIMICLDHNENGHNDNSKIIRRHRVVIKVPTVYGGGSGLPLGDKVQMYERLVQNVPAEMKHSFAVPVGTTELMLSDMEELAKKELAKKEINLNTADKLIRSELFRDGFYSGGQNKGTRNPTMTINASVIPFISTEWNVESFLYFHPKATLEARRQIVRNLLVLFWIMFQQKMVHGDISYGHIIVQPHAQEEKEESSSSVIMPDNDISDSSVGRNRRTQWPTLILIDFDRYTFLDDALVLNASEFKKSLVPTWTEDKQTPSWLPQQVEKLQGVQLRQLLSLIGHACTLNRTNIKFLEDHLRFPNNMIMKDHYGTDLQLLQERLIPAFDRCGFPQAMVWTNGTASLDNPKQTYQDLAAWSEQDLPGMATAKTKTKTTAPAVKEQPWFLL